MRAFAAACTLIALCVGLAFAAATAVPLPEPVKDSDYRPVDEQKARLGQLLFYDRVLSGTYRVSCATCHNHDRAGSNGFLLDPSKEVKTDELAINGLPLYTALRPSSDHAPALFNLGSPEFSRMFSNGRVERRADGSLSTPAGKGLPKGLHDVLAAQALFPTLEGEELVGLIDSDLKRAAEQGSQKLWKAIAKRVQEIPEYWPHFQKAFPELKKPEEITVVEIVNAISSFVSSEWRSDKAPFDAYLRGDKSALSAAQKRGMELFYGKGGCAACHSGSFQTDHNYHATGLPLWRFDVELNDADIKLRPSRDAVTGKTSDRYRYKTPSLRNVARTAPYGHAGTFETLKETLQFHIDPVGALDGYVKKRLGEKQPAAHLEKTLNELRKSVDMKPVVLKDSELNDLIAFLNALTDENALKGRLGKPEDVPSNLVIE